MAGQSGPSSFIVKSNALTSTGTIGRFDLPDYRPRSSRNALMMESPLSLTMNPRLDAALADGCDAWERAVRSVGLARATTWASQRAGEDVPKEDLHDFLAALIEAGDEDERTVARAELAELLEENDDALADVLWEKVLQRGFETVDPDLIFEASSHLAGIADDNGDPLAAAEYFIDFLNWRRRPESVSDTESVQTAFDEIVRLAESDGEPKVAAQYTFWQVEYTRIAVAEGEQATSGDWAPQRAPFESWA